MSSTHSTKQKQVCFKAYKELEQLENALKHLKEENTPQIQVSVLGKVSQFHSDKDIESSQDETIIKLYWKDLSGKSVNFGIFYNPESGSVFIVGSLAAIFLHKINGKSLATLSSGPYGIFRGIGVTETKATNYLKLLNCGHYLLILRGNEDKIRSLETLINEATS